MAIALSTLVRSNVKDLLIDGKSPKISAKPDAPSLVYKLRAVQQLVNGLLMAMYILNPKPILSE